MVTYGPWQESRIHEEVHYARVTSDGSGGIVLNGEEPTQRSGWRLEFNRGFTVTGSASEFVPGGLSDPPAPKPYLSVEGFENALAQQVGGSSADLQFTLHHTGANVFNNNPATPGWTQTQQWDFTGADWRVWFDANLKANAAATEYAVPIGFDANTSDYYTEFENGAKTPPVEIVSAEVLPPAPDASLGLFVKDADTDGAAPFLNSAVAQGGASSSIEQAKGFPEVGTTPLPLDHQAMYALITERVPWVGSSWDVDGRMPTMAALYKGPALNNATVDGSSGYDDTLDGLQVAVRIRYRWRRWRQVFYEDPTVPFRRTFPRDDALGVGGRRTWPPSKAVQSSNRTFGGYL